ncbi:MAG TPA: VanZ family protein [Chitinophagaceae bacterium]|nr:VanZ family protein [Chitinophagaceae bacterium]
MSKTKRLAAIFMLITYSIILVDIMVFKNVPLIRIGPLIFKCGGTHPGSANLVPFNTILPYLLGKKGFVIAFINLAGNIFLLVPVGFLVPVVYNGITWKKSLVLAVATGFAVEGTQAVLHVGIFDIDDVLLNGLGAMAGYWLFTVLIKLARSIKSKKIIFDEI